MLEPKSINITIINHGLADQHPFQLLTQSDYVVNELKITDLTALNEQLNDIGDLLIIGRDWETQLPDQDGQDLNEILRIKYPDIPVIFLKDYGDLPEFQTAIFSRIFSKDVSDRLEFSHRIKQLKQQGIDLSRDLSNQLQKTKETSDLALKTQSEFLTRISHELRIPLNGILGFSQLMNWDKLLTMEQRGYTEIIYESGKQLLSLVNDILEMSKIQSHRLEIDKKVFVIREMINDLQHIFSPKVEKKNLELILKIAEDVPICVQSDEVKLRQILVNILNNAVQSTQTGNITLHTFISLDTLTQTLNLVFEIEDTGAGIPNLEIEAIFEPFVQSGLKFEDGTGLGLSISKHFAALLGGDLKVNSNLGEGTTFTLTIPAEIPHNLANSNGDRLISLEAQQTGSNLKILLAEDSLVDQKVLVRILNKMGYAVDVAGDGLQVLAALELKSYHIIFMDVQMPNMNGIEATRQILQKFEKAPTIIALTSGALPEDRTRCLNAGMHDFMSKPIRPKQLKAVLDHWEQKLIDI